jgi:hypothetical protein
MMPLVMSRDELGVESEASECRTPNAKAATVTAGVALLAWDAIARCSLPTDVEPRPEMLARHWR